MTRGRRNGATIVLNQAITLMNIERGRQIKVKKTSQSLCCHFNWLKEEAYTAQHEWAFSISTVYDPSKHKTCISVNESNSAWYITACKNFFVSLEDKPKGGLLSANNDSYVIRVIG